MPDARTNPPSPRIAVVLEWENAGAIEAREALALFAANVASILDTATARTHETHFVIIHDERVDAAQLMALLNAALGDLPARPRIDILSAPDAPYYQKKGLAPFVVEADILAFIDSDCAYVAGWLDAIVGPLIAGEADVVAGSTLAMDSDTTIARASTLAWFFALPHAADPLLRRQPTRFFANNFAARRAVMTETPIPRLSGSRSHGGAWRALLRASGRRIVHAEAAVARHKQFDSVSDLMARALLLGRDKDAAVSLEAGRLRRVLRATAAIGETHGKFLRRFFAVAPRAWPAWQWPAIFALGLVFQGVACAAQLVAAATAAPASDAGSYDALIATAKTTALGG